MKITIELLIKFAIGFILAGVVFLAFRNIMKGGI
jgi:hypothetical protein